MIITGDGVPKKTKAVHDKAKELFGSLVSDIIESGVNGYSTFMVAPDGSKEFWERSDDYNAKRSELADLIDSHAYGDGSNHIQFVDVGFDEYYEVEIDRSNTRKGEIFD